MTTYELEILQDAADKEGFHNIENMLSVYMENKFEDGATRMPNVEYLESTSLNSFNYPSEIMHVAAAYITEFGYITVFDGNLVELI